MTGDPDPTEDPVLARRERIRRLADVGQKLGYLGFAVAVVVFVFGFVVGFSEGLVGVIVTSMIVGSVLLAPSIVLGYAVRAAERDERS